MASRFDDVEITLVDGKKGLVVLLEKKKTSHDQVEVLQMQIAQSLGARSGMPKH